MLYVVIFKAEYGNGYYEGIRTEAESALQAAVNAARISKHHKLVQVTEENGLLSYGDKTIPTSYKGTSIPFVALYERGNIKISTLEIPFSIDKEKREEKEVNEESISLAIRNILLRKEWSENGGKTPPNHILVGESHLEIGVFDSYDGWDDNIQPYHILRFE